MSVGRFDYAEARFRKAKALAALRDAEEAGWRLSWRYHRDFEPALAMAPLLANADFSSTGEIPSERLNCG